MVLTLLVSHLTQLAVLPMNAHSPLWTANNELGNQLPILQLQLFSYRYPISQCMNGKTFFSISQLAVNGAYCVKRPLIIEEHSTAHIT